MFQKTTAININKYHNKCQTTSENTKKGFVAKAMP